MKRFHVLLSTAVLFGFILPHCAVGGFLLPGAVAAPPVIEHQHNLECDDDEEEREVHENHENHDCCDGCLACQKDKEYAPYSNREHEIVTSLSVAVRSTAHDLYHAVSKDNSLLDAAVNRPLFEQASEHARILVKRE